MSQTHSSATPLGLLAPYQSVPPGYGDLVHTPDLNDVLCGRGGRINSYIGNIRFRKIVNAYKADYLSKITNNKVIKARIAARIVLDIRSSVPAGRFLKVDTNTGLWIEIGDGKAKQKTAQTLRDDSSKFRRVLLKGDGTEEALHLTPTKRATPDIIKSNFGHDNVNRSNNNEIFYDCFNPPGNITQRKISVSPVNLDASAPQYTPLSVTSYQPDPPCRKHRPHTDLSPGIDQVTSVDLSKIKPPDMLNDGDENTVDSYNLQLAILGTTEPTEQLVLKPISTDSSYHELARMINALKRKSHVDIAVENLSSKTGDFFRDRHTNNRHQEDIITEKMGELTILKKDKSVSAQSQDKIDVRSEWRQQMMQVQEKRQNKKKSISTTVLQKQSSSPSMDNRHDACTSLGSIPVQDLLSLGSYTMIDLYSIDDNDSWMKSFKTIKSSSTSNTSFSELTTDVHSLNSIKRTSIKSNEMVCC